MRLTAFVARRRVTLGFVLGAVALFLARPTWPSLAVGVPIAVAGEALRFWAAGHLETGREVTVSGPYRWTRHPIYLGSSLMGLGLAVASASLVVILLVLGYLSFTLTVAAFAEERHLETRFGEAYQRYRAGDLKPVSRRFSASRAWRNGEHRTVAGLLCVAAYLIARAATS